MFYGHAYFTFLSEYFTSLETKSLLIPISYDFLEVAIFFGKKAGVYRGGGGGVRGGRWVRLTPPPLFKKVPFLKKNQIILFCIFPL